jgi:hypothetical protein
VNCFYQIHTRNTSPTIQIFVRKPPRALKNNVSDRDIFSLTIDGELNKNNKNFSSLKIKSILLKALKLKHSKRLRL